MPPISSATTAITLNGVEREILTSMTVATLVSELAPEARMIAVERNGEIVPRQRWIETRIVDGDRIEIVRFVQGG